MDVPFPDVDFRSPLTGHASAVQVVQAIDARQLIEGYATRHKLDVAPLFAGIERLWLLRDAETGLGFFRPLITGDEAFYAALAQRPGYYRPEKAEFRIAAPHIPRGARVCEVGGGVGHFSAFLDQPDYLGLEFNEAAVAQAAGHGIKMLRQDVCDLAREQAGAFDAVCAFQVLEHVADPLAILEAVVALVRPGGTIVLSTPNAHGYITRCRDLLNVPPHHVTWWEDGTWRWVASRFGLTLRALEHTPIDEMLGAWAQMVASDGVARLLGLALDPVVDETPQRARIDAMAAHAARIIAAGVRHRADAPAFGHTSIAVFTR
ncbi:MAG: class I SAM-dependent methyltransferase [Acetobacteraceae bacterium]|nr:class I SAM-dependent methyltransferase [Acetobacteraceae bacterium]